MKNSRHNPRSSNSKSPKDPKLINRNKPETIKLFKDAALRLLQRGGVKALGINSLTREAGKSKSLIYSYFGGIDGVLREVLENNDPWRSYHLKIRGILNGRPDEYGKDLAAVLAKEYFHKFSTSKLAQEISLLELSGKNNYKLQEIADSREQLCKKMFSLSEKPQSEKKVNTNVVFALLVGGINYLVLHANSNGSTFCGIDIKSKNGKERMDKTLEQIITWAFESKGESARS